MSSLPVRLGVLGAQHGHTAGKLRWLRDLAEFDLAGVYEPSAAPVRQTRPSPTRQAFPTWTTSTDC